MIFIIPEIILVLCVLLEARQEKMPKRDTIWLIVICEIVLALYTCLYFFAEKDIIYVSCSCTAVLGVFIAYTDIKEKLISVWYCVAIMIVGILFAFLRVDVAVYNPIITGVVFYLLSKLANKVSKNQIGDGDIYLITGYAVVYGYPLIIKLMFSSLLLGLVVGLIGVILKKFTMKTEMPFAPFMVAGSLLFELLRWL